MDFYRKTPTSRRFKIESFRDGSTRNYRVEIDMGSLLDAESGLFPIWIELKRGQGDATQAVLISVTDHDALLIAQQIIEVVAAGREKQSRLPS